VANGSRAGSWEKKKGKLEDRTWGLGDVDGSFHPGMKETSVGVRTGIECASVKRPRLPWDDCLVEDAVADRYNQRLEALRNWDGDGVAAERVE